MLGGGRGRALLIKRGEPSQLHPMGTPPCAHRRMALLWHTLVPSSSTNLGHCAKGYASRSACTHRRGGQHARTASVQIQMQDRVGSTAGSTARQSRQAGPCRRTFISAKSTATSSHLTPLAARARRRGSARPARSANASWLLNAVSGGGGWRRGSAGAAVAGTAAVLCAAPGQAGRQGWGWLGDHPDHCGPRIAGK